MKTLCYILACILLVSCNDIIEILPDQTEPSNNHPITRVVEEGGEVSTSNPNLLTDWENQTKVTLSTGYKEDLPWVNGNTGCVPPDIARDIKKADGWKMIFHTFTGLNENLHKNYMFFYNELTGILKVFYFSDIETDSNNHFMWEFGTSTNTKTTLFPPTEALFFQPMNSAEKESVVYLSPLTNDSTTGIKRGWNAFIIELPYSNDFVSSNMTFRLTAINKEITNYSFDGTINGCIVGSIQTNSVSQKYENITSHLIKNEDIVNSLNAHVSPSLVTDGVSDNKDIIGIIKEVARFCYKYIVGKGKNSSINQIELHTCDTLSLSGSGEQIVSSQICAMNDIDLSKFNNKQGLGIWNISSSPIFYYERYSRIVPYENEDPNMNAIIISPEIHIQIGDIVINPSIEKYIKTKKVEVDWVYMGKDGHISSRLTNEELEQIGYYKTFSKAPGYILYKSRGSSYTIPIRTVFEDRFKYYYDWGSEDWFNDTIVANITVELVYDYNGEEKNYISCRSFEAIGKEDPVFSSIPSKERTRILKDSDVDFY